MPRSPFSHNDDLSAFIQLAYVLGSKYGWAIVEGAERSGQPVIGTRLARRFSAGHEWIEGPRNTLVDHRLGEFRTAPRTARAFTLIDRGRAVHAATHAFVDATVFAGRPIRVTRLIGEIFDAVMLQPTPGSMTPTQVYAAVHQGGVAPHQRGEGYSLEWLTGRLRALAERGLLERVPGTEVQGREDHYRLAPSLRRALPALSRALMEQGALDPLSEKTPVTRLLPWLASSLRGGLPMPEVEHLVTPEIARMVEVVASQLDPPAVFACMAFAADILSALYLNPDTPLPTAILSIVAPGKNAYKRIERLESLGLVESALEHKVKYWRLVPAARPLLHVMGIDIRELPLSWLPDRYQDAEGVRRLEATAQLIPELLRRNDPAPLSEIGRMMGRSPGAAQELIRPLVEAVLVEIADDSVTVGFAPTRPPTATANPGSVTLSHQARVLWSSGSVSLKRLQPTDQAESRVRRLFDDAGVRRLVAFLAVRDAGTWISEQNVLDRVPRTTLQALAANGLLERGTGGSAAAWRLAWPLWEGFRFGMDSARTTLGEAWTDDQLGRLTAERVFRENQRPLSVAAGIRLRDGVLRSADDLDDRLTLVALGQAFVAASHRLATPLLHVLTSTARDGGIGVPELAAALGADPTAVRELLAPLVYAGIVQQTGRTVTVTPASRAFMDATIAFADRFWPPRHGVAAMTVDPPVGPIL